MADERNWAGNIVFSARRVLRPSSVEQLRTMVAGSRGIRPLGSRHSFSGVADTAGDLVATTGLPTILEIDEDARTVRVDAGV
ncbi:MAG: FAD-binding protein, partial [Phycicoccus sp.]